MPPSKRVRLRDLRGRVLVGLDDMGGAAAGKILAGNVTSGGGDGPTTAAASGGEANHTLLLAEAPTGQFTLNDPGHVHTANLVFDGGASAGSGNIGSNGTYSSGFIGSNTTGVNLTDNAGGGAHNNIQPTAAVNYMIRY